MLKRRPPVGEELGQYRDRVAQAASRRPAIATCLPDKSSLRFAKRRPGLAGRAGVFPSSDRVAWSMLRARRMPGSPNRANVATSIRRLRPRPAAWNFASGRHELTDLAVRILGDNPRTIPMTRTPEAEFVVTVPHWAKAQIIFTFWRGGQGETTRSGFALAAAWRSWPIPRRQSRILSLVRSKLVRHSAQRFHHLRTAYRHIYARGHL